MMTKWDDELNRRMREVLSFDARTGVFRNRFNRSTAKDGEVAGSVSDGYLIISIDDKRYTAHRLAWFWIYGTVPTGDIDHINGVRDDNRITNLRAVSRSVNMQNQRRARSNNIHSGFLGVQKNKDKWQALIRVNDRRICLGTYITPELAYCAYLDAKRKLHEGCAI